MFPYPSGAGLARRTPRRLYSNRYPQPLQTCARLQCSSPNGLGCLWICLQSNTPWIREMTQQNLQRKILLTSKRQIMRFGFLTTGICEVQQIQTTGNGLSGFSPSLRKGLAYEAEVPVNWVKNWERPSPTKKCFLTELLSVEAIQLSANQCANGCSKSRPMQSACSMTWMTLTGQSLSRTCNATGLVNQLVPVTF